MSHRQSIKKPIKAGKKSQTLLAVSGNLLINFCCKSIFFTLNHATTTEQKQVAVTFNQRRIKT